MQTKKFYIKKYYNLVDKSTIFINLKYILLYSFVANNIMQIKLIDLY